jgi:hypothetical protein
LCRRLPPWWGGEACEHGSMILDARRHDNSLELSFI